jgi:hypothetical protein
MAEVSTANATDNTSTQSVLGSAEDKGGTSGAAISDKGAAVDATSGGQQAQTGGDAKQAQVGELEITIPEGFAVDEKVFGEFKGMAKELGMTSEAASKIVAWQLQREQSSIKADEAGRQQQQAEWLKQIKTDPEFGGTRYEHTVHDAKAALLKFGGPAAAAVFLELGIDNHPELVKVFARIGAAIKEDNSSLSGRTTTTAPSANQKLAKMYPSMFNNDGTQKPAGL